MQGTLNWFLSLVYILGRIQFLFYIRIYEVNCSKNKWSEVKVAQACLDSLQVYGIFQARILDWVAIPSPRDPLNPGIEPRSPTLQVDSLPAEPPRKPIPETLLLNDSLILLIWVLYMSNFHNLWVCFLLVLSLLIPERYHPILNTDSKAFISSRTSSTVYFSSKFLCDSWLSASM